MDDAESTAPQRKRHSVLGFLGLSCASIIGGAFLCLTGLAVFLGGWQFVAMGVGAILICAAVGAGSWWPARRRLVAGLALAGLGVSLPIILPIPHAQHDSALIRSRSVLAQPLDERAAVSFDHEIAIAPTPGVGVRSKVGAAPGSAQARFIFEPQCTHFRLCAGTRSAHKGHVIQSRSATA